MAGVEDHLIKVVTKDDDDCDGNVTDNVPCPRWAARGCTHWTFDARLCTGGRVPATSCENKHCDHPAMWRLEEEWQGFGGEVEQNRRPTSTCEGLFVRRVSDRNYLSCLCWFANPVSGARDSGGMRVMRAPRAS